MRMETLILAMGKKVKWKFVGEERDSNSVGKYKIDERISKIKKDKFSDMPLTEEDAKDRRVKFFDGLVVTAIGDLYSENLEFEFVPSRYSNRMSTFELSKTCSTASG